MENQRGVVVPLWAVALSALALPVVRLAFGLRRRRVRRRVARNQCPRCGYDLRATLGRCPECGMVHSETASAR